MIWTRAKMDELVNLVRAGVRHGDLAVMFGVSKTAIENRLRLCRVRGLLPPTGRRRAHGRHGPHMLARTCLTCRRQFMSSGCHNRMCARCVATAESLSSGLDVDAVDHGRHVGVGVSVRG